MAGEKRTFSLGNLFRRQTPKPKDKEVFNPGIQEKNNAYMITSPILYHVAQQSVIVRTCTTQLKNEIFRRGYTWEEKFVSKCKACGAEHKAPVEECKDCGGNQLKKPDSKQLDYANKFLDSYVNKTDQKY